MSESEPLPSCFVVMPFSDTADYPAGHFARVFEYLIEPACRDAGFEAKRVDASLGTTLIHADIVRDLISSPMAVCDLSSLNPNVLFELGFRQAFDMPVQLIQDERTRHIFDVGPLRAEKYDSGLLYGSVVRDRQRLAAAIVATRDNATARTAANSLVRLVALESAARIPTIEISAEDAKLEVIRAELRALRGDVIALRSEQPTSPGIQTGVQAAGVQIAVGDESRSVQVSSGFVKARPRRAEFLLVGPGFNLESDAVQIENGPLAPGMDGGAAGGILRLSWFTTTRLGAGPATVGSYALDRALWEGRLALDIDDIRLPEDTQHSTVSSRFRLTGRLSGHLRARFKTRSRS